MDLDLQCKHLIEDIGPDRQAETETDRPVERQGKGQRELHPGSICILSYDDDAAAAVAAATVTTAVAAAAAIAAATAAELLTYNVTDASVSLYPHSFLLCP